MKYLVEYRHQGAVWGLTIDADSWDDAQERLRMIGWNGRVIGDNAITVPGSMGWFARAFVWLRNQ